jgi:mannose-P-dolichol utilization defect protein 1
MDSIRSALQPITRSLPAPIQDLGTSIIGDQCYKSLILDINVEDSECIKLTISKGLGIGIIAASSIVKVPQILKLVNSKSASGVSFLSYLLETSAYLISLAYNVRQGFPISTYGETGLILVQNVVISVLVLNYSGRATAAAVFVAGLAASGVSLFSENILDMNTLSYLQAGAGVLGVASKLPQILAIWQEGGTGQLSAFAVSILDPTIPRGVKADLTAAQVFNYLLGSLSRIFTTLQEVDDKLILYGFVAGFALNAILALQMVYYWNAPTKSAQVGKKEKAPAVASSGKTTATPKGKGPTTRRRG